MFKMRNLLVFAFLATVIVGTSAGMAQKEGEKIKYKNLKVLPRDITKDDLDKVMRHYNKALNVKCNYCHAKADDGSNKLNYASDAKPEKNVARSMMKMTNKLNMKSFGVKKTEFNQAVMQVSCYTCHRGEAHPTKL